MKQSAVEWLNQEIRLNSKFKQNSKGGISFTIGLSKIDELFIKAKEMEKQQQGYSEEEVENILIEYVKTNPTKPYRVLSWFGEFKRQIRL